MVADESRGDPAPPRDRAARERAAARLEGRRPVIIRRIHVRRVRGLADRTLDCGPGLNVIRGPNDAGKSTLLAALFATLFPVKPSEARSFGPWGDEEHPGEVTIEFEAGGRAWVLSKDFASRKPLLRCGPERWDDPKDVERRVTALLGFESAAVFQATVYVRQWDLAAVRHDHREIGAKLSTIVTGGDADAVRVLQTLDKRIRELETGLERPVKQPGPLKRDLDRIAALTAEQCRLAADAAEIERMAAERERTAARIAELERRVGEDRALLEADARLRDLDKAAAEQERRAREIGELLDRVNAATLEAEEAAHDPALEVAPIPPETLERLRMDAVRVEVLRNELESAGEPGLLGGPGPRSSVEAGSVAREPAAGRDSAATRAHATSGGGAGERGGPGPQRTDARAAGPSAPQTPVGAGGPGVSAESAGDARGLRAARARGAVSAVLAGAAALGGVAALAARHPAWGVVLLIVAAAAGVAAAAFQRHAAGVQRRAESVVLEARVRAEADECRREDEAARIAARREELRYAEASLQERLRALTVSSAEEAVARQARLEEAVRRRDAARDRVATLLGGRTSKGLAAEMRAALVDLGATRAQRDDPALAPLRLDAAAYQRLLAESGCRGQELAAKTAALHRLDGRLAELHVRAPREALTRTEEELAETQARYARERRLVSALRLAAEVLRDAHQATLVGGRTLLEEGAGRYLRRLSNGAYARVAVDEETLAPRVWVGPPKEWADVSAGEVGSGGADQCYLALRIALADVFDPEYRAPLFMDDPLLAYDDDRAAAARACLREVARTRQIFLLTCRRGVHDAYADHVAVFEAEAAQLPAAPSRTV